MSKRFNQASAHPLHWPDNWPRTKSPQKSQFRSTLAKALNNVNDELARFAADSGKKIEGLIISSNYSLTDSRPSDPGVCVYFTWNGEQTCIPVDRYNKIECNLQAIYHCIEAERTKLRHGGINLVKASFRGYATLPPPEQSESWFNVLGVAVNCSLEDAEKAYMRLRSKHHPDRGGDSNKFKQVTNAWIEASEKLSK